MTNTVWLYLVMVVILLPLYRAAVPDSEMIMKKKIEYFKPVNLTCDSIHLNVSDNWQIIDSMRWMLPDASLIMDTKDQIQISKKNNFPYMITIDRVGDDEFGYYTCIIVYKSASGPNTVRVVQWALNVDGPDFTRLRNDFADQAIVGAIAAGVLLGVLGLTCILWHYRYNSRKKNDLKLQESSAASYQYKNTAFNDADTKVDVHFESANGSTSKTDSDKIDVHM